MARRVSQQTPAVGPILVWCWPSVVDDGPTSAQHWENASCLLDTYYTLCYLRLCDRHWLMSNYYVLKCIIFLTPGKTIFLCTLWRVIFTSKNEKITDSIAIDLSVENYLHLNAENSFSNVTVQFTTKDKHVRRWNKLESYSTASIQRSGPYLVRPRKNIRLH